MLDMLVVKFSFSAYIGVSGLAVSDGYGIFRNGRVDACITNYLTSLHFNYVKPCLDLLQLNPSCVWGQKWGLNLMTPKRIKQTEFIKRVKIEQISLRTKLVIIFNWGKINAIAPE